MAGRRPLDMSVWVATHRECAKELTLRSAAEVTDVRIPVQICRTFQTRDFLEDNALACLPNHNVGVNYLRKRTHFFEVYFQVTTDTHRTLRHRFVVYMWL